MGEKQYRLFQSFFNATLKVGFHGYHVTFDDGLILMRELEKRPGFGERCRLI